MGCFFPCCRPAQQPRGPGMEGRPGMAPGMNPGMRPGMGPGMEPGMGGYGRPMGPHY